MLKLIGISSLLFLSNATIYAQSTESSPFGFHEAIVLKQGYSDLGYVDAENIGVNWERPASYAFWAIVQPNLNDSNLDFGLQDLVYGNVPVGINILGNILPAPPAPEFQSYCLTNSYFPSDSAKYMRFVRKLVERFDGDGVDDKPGLTNPVKYWQVGNEPNISTNGFTDLQRITYTAIKQADPEAKVLIAGVGGFPYNYISGMNGFDAVYVPILAQLAGSSFDIMDFHWFGNASGEYKFIDTETGEDVLTHIRNKLDLYGYSQDIPIWITEMGSYSGDPFENPVLGSTPFQSELQQASDIIKRYVYSLSRGVKKVFSAFGLMEGFMNDDGYFDHTGFIYDGDFSNDPGLGVRKLSYYSYKLMTQTLNGSNWNNVQTILENNTDNTHVYKFTNLFSLEPTYVAWWDYFDSSSYFSNDSLQITFSGINSSKAIITEAVPDVATGSSVVNFINSFKRDTLNVLGGSLSFYIKERPVYITEYYTTEAHFISPKESINCFPNPVKGFLNIRGVSDKNNLKIEIFDAIGNLIISVVSQDRIDVSKMTSGLYIIKISENRNSIIEKLVIAN